MPHKTQNQPGAQSQLPLGPLTPSYKPIHHGSILYPSVHVDLGVKEDFSMVDPILTGFNEVIPSEILEVTLVDKNGHSLEVECEKVIQRGKMVVAIRESLD